MARTQDGTGEMGPVPAILPNRAFLEPAASPWVALPLAATIRQADRSTRATHARRQSRRCEPLRPRGGSLPTRALADPFASRLRFPARPRASAGLRRSFALR